MHYRPTDPWLLPFLRRVKERPGSYLGHESARQLLRYLEGYVQARADLGFPVFPEPDGDLLQQFEQWLKERLGKERSTCGWCDIIEMLDPSDRNIKAFFKEFESFLSSIGRDLNVDRTWPPR